MSDTQTMNPAAIGKSLKEARETAGFSRARLGELTSISPRAIEKFEAGTQEPSATRLRALCAALQINPVAFLEVSNPEKAELPRDPASPVLKEMDPIDRASLILEEIDGMRLDGFKGDTRKALALADMAKLAMAHLEPEDLWQLAQSCGITQFDLVGGNTILDAFKSNPCKAHALCSSLEDRVVDTALLGVDLASLDEEQVEAIADELVELKAIEGPGFFGDWPDKNELVLFVRPSARQVLSAGMTLMLLSSKPAQKAG